MTNLQNRFNQFKTNIKISDEKTAQVFVNWKPMQMLSFTITTEKSTIQEFILLKKLEELDRTPSILTSKVSNVLAHFNVIECHRVKMKSFKVVGNLAKFWIQASLNLLSATDEKPHELIFRDGTTLKIKHGFINREISIDISKESISEAIAKFLNSFTVKSSSPKLELKPLEAKEQTSLEEFNTRVRRVLHNIPAPAIAPVSIPGIGIGSRRLLRRHENQQPQQVIELEKPTRPTAYTQKPAVEFLKEVAEVKVELFKNPIRDAYEKALAEEEKYNKEKEKERENYMFKIDAKDFYYKLEEIYTRKEYVSINNYIFMQSEKSMTFVMARNVDANEIDEYKDYLITVVNPEHKFQISEFAVALETLNDKDPKEAIKLATRLRIDAEIESIINICKDGGDYGDLCYDIS